MVSEAKKEADKRMHLRHNKISRSKNGWCRRVKQAIVQAKVEAAKAMIVAVNKEKRRQAMGVVIKTEQK